MQFYSDSGLSIPIPDNARLKAGTYYLKITANGNLTAAPKVSINAEGTANDKTDDPTSFISGNDYKYTYVIKTDTAAIGATLADLSVTGTGINLITSTNVNPTNESTKAIYTDTTPDAAPGIPDMTAVTDTGSSSTDTITSDTTPNFVVSCVTGSIVTLYNA